MIADPTDSTQQGGGSVGNPLSRRDGGSFIKREDEKRHVGKSLWKSSRKHKRRGRKHRRRKHRFSRDDESKDKCPQGHDCKPGGNGNDGRNNSQGGGGNKPSAGGPDFLPYGNPIDDCWMQGGNWEKDRKQLANCVPGFGRGTRGGAHGDYYYVTSNEDDPKNPKEGTLRYGLTRVSAGWYSRCLERTDRGERR